MAHCGCTANMTRPIILHAATPTPAVATSNNNNKLRTWYSYCVKLLEDEGDRHAVNMPNLNWGLSSHCSKTVQLLL